jgi:deazaflavin-dependent oxidoreductase (nitroreductase family)
VSTPADFNAQVIEEFRANGGRVGGMFEGRPLLLLHHTGARSGAARVNPLVYLPDGGRYVIFASKAGAPTNPDWYHNLLANPDVTVEIGTETFAAQARLAAGEERERIWEKQKSDWPGFAGYEEKTAGIREIPVFVLDLATT